MSIQSKDDATYRTAWKKGDTAIYADDLDCWYTAKRGNLAWRINNPGLIRHHSRYARKNGSIGTWEKFAIFSNPLQGHQALREWLRSKTRLQADLYAIGEHYQPFSSEQFAQSLALAARVDPKTKLKDLTPVEFEALQHSIEKLCGFTRIGNEEFLLLPKIVGKIECPGKEDLFLVGQSITLTQDEAVEWINSQRLDAVVVHHPNGTIHLRSRPGYHMQTLRLTWEQHCETAGEIPNLARVIGKKKVGQCIWGFINGVSNTKEKALKSGDLISKSAGNEQVLSLQNDQNLLGLTEVGLSILLKLGVESSIIKRAVQFLRYLLSLSEDDEHSPVIIFAHSQGAAIAEHALTALTKHERQRIRIFTFGGWSFIAPGVAHPDSHNFASVGDLISMIGSYNSQYLAIRRYEGFKEGLKEEEIIRRLAFGDAIHDLDCLNPHLLEKYTQERCNFYRNEFEKIINVTVIDSESQWEHSFDNENYQAIVRSFVDKYRKIVAQFGFQPQGLLSLV
jgi:hypothetical protein